MSRGFLLLTLLTVFSSIQVSPAKPLKALMQRWVMYTEECSRNNSREPPLTGVVCNRTFDMYACWPDGLPNTTVSVSCPWYLPWHHKVQHGWVYRECDADGQWVPQKNTSECDANDPAQPHYGQILKKFQTMYTVGYSLSLGALVLALGVLITFSHPPCPLSHPPCPLSHPPCPLSHPPCPLSHPPCPLSHPPLFIEVERCIFIVN
eukprot:XP_014041329.1 PREDICTED: glucagon receptor-like isoform X2 [Salmo salar]